ncbi:MAG: molybdenum cofactor guanylyltransferase [Burkholderiaceae bacterium]|nr:molybdenum cofactor guanylyltransferase [Burkholderiaceae bacterium]
MTTSLTPSALILAGGQGQRMGGQDKGWVRWQGKPLIEHALDRVRQQTVVPPEILISANRHLDEYALTGARVVQDLRTGFAGPLAGIEAGLIHAKHDWVLVTTCDMPLIPLNLLEKLYLGLDGRSVAVALVDKKLSPLTILLSRFLVKSVSAYLDSGQAAVKPWLKSLNMAVVEFEEPESFVNINTLKETNDNSTEQ